MLFDTSVWIDHFRKKNLEISDALVSRSLVICDVIIGELAAGSIPKRRQTLRDLMLIESLPLPTLTEILHFVDSHRLFSLGLSYADLQILAAVIIAEAELVTKDRRLARAYELIS